MTDSQKSLLQIGLLSAIFLTLVGAYSYFTPFFEAPDAGAHYRYIAFLDEQRRLPELSIENAAISHQLVQQPPFYYALAALFIPNDLSQRALTYEVPNPYFTKGMSPRAVITPPKAESEIRWPLRVARAISTLGGLLTLICTFLLAKALLPKEPAFAFASTSVTALNPQFIFGSAVITNDSWAAGLSTLALLGAVLNARCADQAPAKWQGLGLAWRWLLVGICAGMAALTKYSCVLLLIPLYLLLLLNLLLDDRQSSRKWRLLHSALFSVGWLISAGGLIVPNLIRYGTPVPTGQILTLLPGLARSEPLTWAALWEILPRLQTTYWGVFGYGIMSPHWYYRWANLIVLTGLIGLIVHVTLRLAAQLRRASLRIELQSWDKVFLMLLSWVVVIVVSLLAWIRMVHAGDQGRLLFPAVAAVGVLLVVGWRQLMPKHLRSWLLYALAIAVTVVATVEIGTIRRGFALPEAVAQSAAYVRPINAAFQSGMELVAVEFPQGAAVDAGGAMPVHLYLRTNTVIDDFYTLFLHLATEEDQILFQFDGVPAQGRHPTPQWIPGQLFSETLYVLVGEIKESTLATLSMGFYRYDDASSREKVIKEDGQLGADRVILGKIRIHAKGDATVTSVEQPSNTQAQPVNQNAVAIWADQIALSAYDVTLSDETLSSKGRTAKIALTWESIVTLHQDYTLFLQMIDTEGNVLDQIDQFPQNGDFPTSTWRAGDLSQEGYSLSSESTTPSQIIVGFYDNELRRLQLTEPQPSQGASTVQDHFVLWRLDE